MQGGLVDLIFAKPQSKINDPAKLHLLIQMIDSENWTRLDVDVKGEAYEGLLNAVAGKVDSGPKALVRLRDFHDRSLSRGQKLSRRATEERGCKFFWFLRRVCWPLSRGSYSL
jgi:hypothetical protein